MIKSKYIQTNFLKFAIDKSIFKLQDNVQDKGLKYSEEDFNFDEMVEEFNKLTEKYYRLTND